MAAKKAFPSGSDGNTDATKCRINFGLTPYDL